MTISESLEFNKMLKSFVHLLINLLASLGISKITKFIQVNTALQMHNNAVKCNNTLQILDISSNNTSDDDKVYIAISE